MYITFGVHSIIVYVFVFEYIAVHLFSILLYFAVQLLHCLLILSGGLQFVPSSAVFAFDGQSIFQCFSVTILNDDVPELCFTFAVAVSTTAPRVQFRNDEAVVTILDDEGMCA